MNETVICAVYLGWAWHPSLRWTQKSIYIPFPILLHLVIHIAYHNPSVSVKCHPSGRISDHGMNLCYCSSVLGFNKPFTAIFQSDRGNNSMFLSDGRWELQCFQKKNQSSVWCTYVCQSIGPLCFVQPEYHKYQRASEMVLWYYKDMPVITYLCVA